MKQLSGCSTYFECAGGGEKAAKTCADDLSHPGCSLPNGADVHRGCLAQTTAVHLSFKVHTKLDDVKYNDCRTSFPN
jgi:hypothetical protein